MKCNCSSINKHEIVGLCDIEKFNEKIKEFNDKSWVQVSISDNSIHLGNRPSIKTITKTFVDVKITSTKLINTPKSQETNIEGLRLTGKLLLIGGEIKQRILYISNSCNSDRINSFKIKSSFTTHIVVDENIDIAQDKFCIYTCIEHSSIIPINECTLNQNVTLFLFAHRINNLNPPGPEPPPKPYPNDIIFKNDSNEELAKVVFNTGNNKLTVTNTDKVQTGSREIILEFEIFNNDGTTKRETGQILGSQDASQFSSDLNGKSFNHGDIINIIYYRNTNRVNITNYPVTGQDYQPIFSVNEAFIVTQTGLVPYELPNKIIAENSSNQKVAEVTFTKLGRRIKVISTGNKLDYGLWGWILTLQLVNSTGTLIKQGIILNDSDGTQFKTRLDNTEYSIGNIVQIGTGSNNIKYTKITNYPSSGDIYSFTKVFERFEITDNGLVKINSNYPNEITLRTRTGDTFGKLIFPFDIERTKLIDIDYSTQETGSSDIIIEVKLYASDGISEKAKGTLKEGENIRNFSRGIDYKPFEYGDIIEINSTNNQNRIEISNFPVDGQNYTPRSAVERFRIGFDRFTKA